VYEGPAELLGALDGSLLSQPAAKDLA
jgi:hypothetical protein